jgi:hypothetical protein
MWCPTCKNPLPTETHIMLRVSLCVIRQKVRYLYLNVIKKGLRVPALCIVLYFVPATVLYTITVLYSTDFITKGTKLF